MATPVPENRNENSPDPSDITALEVSPDGEESGRRQEHQRNRNAGVETGWPGKVEHRGCNAPSQQSRGL